MQKLALPDINTHMPLRLADLEKDKISDLNVAGRNIVANLYLPGGVAGNIDTELFKQGPLNKTGTINAFFAVAAQTVGCSLPALQLLKQGHLNLIVWVDFQIQAINRRNTGAGLQ